MFDRGHAQYRGDGYARTPPADLLFLQRKFAGTFLLCTFWLARVLADGGRTGEARAVFENAVSHVNDVGLLAEEIDSETGEQLGNFPQAFSHVGLVNAAWAIHQAEQP